MAYGDVQLPVDGAGTKLLTITGMPAQPPDVEAEATASINLDGSQVPPAESASATTPASIPFFNPALDENAVEVNPSPGRLWGYHLFNPGVSTVYVQFYDLDLASVVVGTTPPSWVFALPSNSYSPFGVDNELSVPVGCQIALCVAATSTPTGAGAPAADVLASLFYT